MTSTTAPASVVRRLASIFYDSLLVFALLFFATALLLPFTHGQSVQPGNPLYFIYLLLVSFGYFGLSWTRGGQTLGMRAWRIRAVQLDGQPITWAQAGVRFCTALCGLGLLTALFGFEPLQDRLSDTVIVEFSPP